MIVTGSVKPVNYGITYYYFMLWLVMYFIIHRKETCQLSSMHTFVRDAPLGYDSIVIIHFLCVCEIQIV